MDWEPTRTTVTASARTRQSQPVKEGARAKWVSKEVRSQRWEAGECLRCGSQDHLQGNCRLRPARPPTVTDETRKGPQKRLTAASSAVKAKVGVEEIVTDDSDSEEDSGKE